MTDRTRGEVSSNFAHDRIYSRDRRGRDRTARAREISRTLLTLPNIRASLLREQRTKNRRARAARSTIASGRERESATAETVGDEARAITWCRLRGSLDVRCKRDSREGAFGASEPEGRKFAENRENRRCRARDRPGGIERFAGEIFGASSVSRRRWEESGGPYGGGRFENETRHRQDFRRLSSVDVISMLRNFSLDGCRRITGRVAGTSIYRIRRRVGYRVRGWLSKPSSFFHRFDARNDRDFERRLSISVSTRREFDKIIRGGGRKLRQSRLHATLEFARLSARLDRGLRVLLRRIGATH